jgi:hypothetical protein
MIAADARNVLESIRIIETREAGARVFEICATASAAYYDDTHDLVVELASMVRAVHHDGPDEELHPSWLPRADKVRIHLDREEAPEAAKDVFQAWSRKVRESIPGSEEWREDAAWLKP